MCVQGWVTQVPRNFSPQIMQHAAKLITSQRTIIATLGWHTQITVSQRLCDSIEYVSKLHVQQHAFG